MAGKRFGPFIGPSEPLLDRKASAQRSINLYMAEVEGGGEEKQYVLESAPGLQTFLTFPGDVRGWCVARGLLFVVADNQFISVNPDGSSTYYGAMSTSVGYVSMREMRDMVVIVDGPNGYTYNFSTFTFGRITDPDWRGSSWVEELDGYAVFNASDSDQFYLSAIDDATSLDALDFSSSDSQPDDIVTHRVVKRELLLLGKRSIETWVNSGDADFPFVRYNSTPIDVGVVGNRAAVNAAETLYWVGQTGRGAAYVYELQGHQPVRISTQAVEEAIATSTDLTSLSMWAYQSEGSEFIGINAPGMNTTWVFDVSTRKWHERCELNSGEYVASRVDLVIHFAGKHYVAAGAVMYEMSRDFYTVAGAELPRERIWPHLLKSDYEPVAYKCLEIACTTGSETAGRVVLQISNDGGYTFGTFLERSLGVVGRRMQRVRWWGLGASRDRVFKVRVTDPVPVTFHSAAVLT